MTEGPQIVIRDGQWLGSGAPLYADYGDEECRVTFDEDVESHPHLAELPDDEMGQSVRSPREAMYRASAAATRAKARGSVDDDGAIRIMVEDLEE